MAGIGIRWNGSSSGDVPGFKPMGTSSQNVTSNAGSAADAVSVGNVWGSIRAKSPKYDEIGSTAEDIRLAENMAALDAESTMEAAGIKAYGAAARGKLEADMYDKAANAQGKAGMMGLFGGIAGGALKLMSGGLA